VDWSKCSLLSQAHALAASLGDVTPLLNAAAHRQQGEQNAAQRGVGYDFWQYRQYDAADPAKAIDWRRSARGDTLLVKEFDQQKNPVWYLWADGAATMAYSSSPKLLSKEDVATVILYTLGIVLGRHGLFGVNGAKPKNYPDVAAMPPADASCWRHQRQTDGALLLISDCLTSLDNINQCLLQSKTDRYPAVLLHLHDPAERDFPFEGAVLFTGLGDASRLHAPKAEEFKAAYQQRYKEHAEAVEKQCLQHGFHYLQHSTDAPLLPLLQNLVKVLAVQNR
jgi:uncharacterized protein (DUF58 family)